MLFSVAFVIPTKAKPRGGIRIPTKTDSSTPPAAPLRMTSALEIGNLGRLQLKLELISDQCNELRIGGLAFGI